VGEKFPQTRAMAPRFFFQGFIKNLEFIDITKNKKLKILNIPVSQKTKNAKESCTISVFLIKKRP
jgi:hypothetical protein